MALKLSLEEYRGPMDDFSRENRSRNSTIYEKINKIETIQMLFPTPHIYLISIAKSHDQLCQKLS